MCLRKFNLFINIISLTFHYLFQQNIGILGKHELYLSGHLCEGMESNINKLKPGPFEIALVHFWKFEKKIITM